MTDDLCDFATIARYLDVDRSTINGWKKSEGFPQAVTRGKYSIQATIKWFASYQLQKGLKNARPAKVTEDDAKVRKLVAEAELKELELSKAKGELVMIDDARREIDHKLSVVRSNLLSFASRTAPFVVQIPTENDARVLLDSHIRQMMESMVAQSEAIPESEADDEAEQEANDT